jgi:hypothetical protein
MAPRIQSSSSTTDMSEFSVNWSFHYRVDKGRPGADYCEKAIVSMMTGAACSGNKT